MEVLAFDHGEHLLTACSRDHLETLVTAYEQRPFDMEELWASILLEAHRRLGPTATTRQILEATGLTPCQLNIARDWHTHHHLPDHGTGAGHEHTPDDEDRDDEHNEDRGGPTT